MAWTKWWTASKTTRRLSGGTKKPQKVLTLPLKGAILTYKERVTGDAKRENPMEPMEPEKVKLESLVSLWRELVVKSEDSKLNWPRAEAKAVIEGLSQVSHDQDASFADVRVREIVSSWSDAHDGNKVMVERLAFLPEVYAKSNLDQSPGIQPAIRKLISEATSVVVEPLSAQALTDPLTGCGNRRALDKAIEVSISEARRHQYPLSIVSVDLDGLKKINDGMGHKAGDAALAGLAKAMGHRMRKHDQLFRVGGDEFLALLGHTTVEETANLMERIQSDGAPSFSWGVATYSGGEVVASELIDLADQDLYTKRRNRYHGTLNDFPKVHERGNKGKRNRRLTIGAAIVAILTAFITTQLGSGLPQKLSTSTSLSPGVTSGLKGSNGIMPINVTSQPVQPIGNQVGPTNVGTRQSNNTSPIVSTSSPTTSSTSASDSTTTSPSSNSTTSSTTATTLSLLSPIVTTLCGTLNNLLGGSLLGATTTTAC
ncbi:MAG: GGDEF domain-containing protein [Acidimicrobiales bacterium]|nr:GGDEF domain-containing protein [Acidimicrobiales bacterium]